MAFSFERARAQNANPNLANPPLHAHAYRAHYLMNKHLERQKPVLDHIRPLEQLLDSFREKFSVPERAAKPVCIIGAGVAGLYAAMILKSLDIKFEIIEAGNRVGGRLFTHYFGKKDGSDYKYYVRALYTLHCIS